MCVFGELWNCVWYGLSLFSDVEFDYYTEREREYTILLVNYDELMFEGGGDYMYL